MPSCRGLLVRKFDLNRTNPQLADEGGGGEVQVTQLAEHSFQLSTFTMSRAPPKPAVKLADAATAQDPHALPESAGQVRRQLLKAIANHWVVKAQEQIIEQVLEGGVPLKDAVSCMLMPKESFEMLDGKFHELLWGEYFGHWEDGYATMQLFYAPKGHEPIDAFRARMRKIIAAKKAVDTANRLQKAKEAPLNVIKDKDRGMTYTVRPATEKDVKDFSDAPKRNEDIMSEVQSLSETALKEAGEAMTEVRSLSETALKEAGKAVNAMFAAERATPVARSTSQTTAT